MSQEQRAVAAPNQVTTEANDFTIRGPIVIHYSATSFAGVPRFSYKDAERDLQFKGNEIARMDTPVGELVTVTLESDGDVRSFTLLVPKIRLLIDQKADFDTLGIVTMARGGLQTNSLHQLRGIAETVTF
jgi:hypothetical protein